MHSSRCFSCILALNHPKTLGMDQPIIVVIITVMISNEYSGGIGGGSGLKLAVKVPYLITSKVPEESFFGLKPRLHKNESKGELQIVDEFNAIVELWFKFSAQPLNSKPLLGIAVQLVPRSI